MMFCFRLTDKIPWLLSIGITRLFTFRKKINVCNDAKCLTAFTFRQQCYLCQHLYNVYIYKKIVQKNKTYYLHLICWSVARSKILKRKLSVLCKTTINICKMRSSHHSCVKCNVNTNIHCISFMQLQKHLI